MSVSKSFFVSRAFEKFGAKCSSFGALVSMMSWRSFWKLRSVTGHVFANSDYDHEYFWEFPFFFPKQSRCYLQADNYGDPQTEQSTLVMVRWKQEWNLTSGRWRDRAQKDHRSSSRLVQVVCGNPWSKREKTQGSQRVIVRKLNPSSSTIPRVLRSLFPKPDVATVFALRCFRGRGCTAAGRSGCSAGKAKKSSYTWHFRCWSLRRNELECTDLAHCTEAWHRFSSRDAIIVVGSVLEKHFDGDFTPDQEKEITFKRWPPGYQSWKLGLALNGLNTSFRKFKQLGLLEPWFVKTHTIWTSDLTTEHWPLFLSYR